ncbi:OLC1v1034747C1 [Oldenlandia corymbosa var. corymbosa]|uniref:OLC1v1034747C1 n=1 Tax=Oldenlandia corymbosa var. corymbosa TaxID=529605 RepID=A0AAV1CTY1_OLDCO|nr:OLC1v1034747C1 [Oldenlandia corymbosa var. corymbosa]
MNFTVKPVSGKLNPGHQTLLPSVHHHRPLFLRPISSISFRTSPPPRSPSFSLALVRASSSSSFQISNASSEENPSSRLPNKSLNPLQNPNGYSTSATPALAGFPFSFIKTTLIATAAAAAIFFSRFKFFNVKPAFAALSTGVAATVETAPNDVAGEEEKEKMLEEHLDSNPSDVEALRSLMEIRIKNNKLQEAILVVDKLIELEPAEVEWPLMKSHLYIYSGDAESAKKGFSEIISNDPFRVEAYHGLVMAESQDDSSAELTQIDEKIQEAMKMCKKENRKNDLRDFKLLRAQILVIQGKYNDALNLYQELVKEEPRDFRPYLCQGIIYTLLRKNDEAEKSFEKYRRLVPKGHPYARYFEDNMIATKVFAQKVEKEMATSKS